MKLGHEDNSHWISVSDIMSVLMVVFLFVAVAYMNSTQQQNNQIKEMTVAYQGTQLALYESLYIEFKDDLKKWGAELDQNSLSVRFNEPDTLFDINSSNVKTEFKNILKDFFPRYLAVIEQFKNEVAEIRIEGHTDSTWREYSTTEYAYFKNMELSQNRTREVLQYCLTLPTLGTKFEWVSKLITANGLSSSQLRYDERGKEDKERSRRVEFRVKTNIENVMVKIAETVK